MRNAIVFLFLLLSSALSARAGDEISDFCKNALKDGQGETSVSMALEFDHPSDPEPESELSTGSSLLFYKGELSETAAFAMQVLKIETIWDEAAGISILYSRTGDGHNTMANFAELPAEKILGGVHFYSAKKIRNSTWYAGLDGLGVMRRLNIRIRPFKAKVRLPHPLNHRNGVDGLSFLFYRGKVPTEEEKTKMRIFNEWPKEYWPQYIPNEAEGVVMVFSIKGLLHQELGAQAVPKSGEIMGGIRIQINPVKGVVNSSVYSQFKGIQVYKDYFDAEFEEPDLAAALREK